MSFFERTLIGMEISHGGIGAVHTTCHGERIMLNRAAWQPLPDMTLRHALREPQVQTPDMFVKAVRKAWEDLNLSQPNVALSLPDSAGRLFLTTLDTPWKNRNEAAEMLCWKLGKQVGIEPEQVHLDFQVLRRHENGNSDLMAAVMHKTVILQYEELFLEAGLQPFSIGFHTMNLLRLLGNLRSGTGVLIFLYDNCLSVVALSQSKPLFYRTKGIPDLVHQQSELSRELLSSMSACRQACPNGLPEEMHILISPADAQVWKTLAGICPEETSQLQSSAVIYPGPESNLDIQSIYRLNAAVGAVVRGNT